MTLSNSQQCVVTRNQAHYVQCLYGECHGTYHTIYQSILYTGLVFSQYKMPLKYFYHNCGKALEAAVHVIKLFLAEFTFLLNKLECLALAAIFTRLRSTQHLTYCSVKILHMGHCYGSAVQLSKINEKQTGPGFDSRPDKNFKNTLAYYDQQPKSFIALDPGGNVIKHFCRRNLLFVLISQCLSLSSPYLSGPTDGNLPKRQALGLTNKQNIRLERLFQNKNTSLSGTFMNYGHEKVLYCWSLVGG